MVAATQGDRGPATRHRSHDRLETQPGARSIRFEAYRAEEGEDGARSAPAGSLAARSRGSETESTDRRRAHHSRPTPVLLYLGVDDLAAMRLEALDGGLLECGIVLRSGTRRNRHSRRRS